MSKKDTLIIVGNGFDAWQDLKTSYSQFQKYYLNHRLEIIKSLHIKPIILVDYEGCERKLTDVELIYGDSFDISELDDAFWNNYESSLKYIDSQRINLYFGKDRRGLKRMRRSVKNAKRILQKAFSEWIASIDVGDQKADYSFGDNCIFINFNYTYTLENHFGVNEKDVFHIHGEANDPDSIIVGHTSHPQLPEQILWHLQGRFKGLYLIDELLYETDKHVRDNIIFLAMFMASKGIMVEDIKNIYVLGHSMSPVDMEYFLFLFNATKISAGDEADLKEAEFGAEVGDYDPYNLDELQKRMDYTIQHIGYGFDEEDIDEENIQAVMHRFEAEQEGRNLEYQNEFKKMLRREDRKRFKGKATAIDLGTAKPVERTKSANWIISYYGEESRIWYETVMKELGCESYKLFPSIDDCLKELKSSGDED